MLLYLTPQLIQTSFVNLTSDVSTTSTSYVDLSNMTLDVYTSANYLICWFYASPYSSSITNIEFQLMIDGSAKRGTHSRIFNGGYAGACSLLYKEAVTPGLHTVKIQWKTGTGTAQIRAATVTWEQTGLLVEEVII